MTLRKNTFDYKWVILPVCFLMVFVCLGFCSGTKSLYLSPITEALGISRGMYSLNESFRHIATAIVNLFFGTLIYRFGVKKMIGVGFISLIAACLVFAYADSVFTLYIAGTLMGIGAVFTSTTMVSCIIRRWCTTNVGKYTGIVLAANGIGGAVAAQIVSPIINREGDPFSYRDSYLLIALILVISGVIVLALLRERPSEMPIQKGLPKKNPRGTLWSGINYAAARKKSYFYIAAVCILLTGLALQGTSGIYVAHLKDVGIGPEHIATIVSIHSITLTFAKFLIGMLYDRFGLRMVMLTCQSTAALSFIVLLLVDASPTGILLAMLFGAIHSLAMPLETLVIPLITNDIFGTAAYEKILGLFMAMNYTGYALGSPVTNLFYDVFGSYKPIMLVLFGLMGIILAAFQFVINTAHKDKKAILAAKN